MAKKHVIEIIKEIGYNPYNPFKTLAYETKKAQKAGEANSETLGLSRCPFGLDITEINQMLYKTSNMQLSELPGRQIVSGNVFVVTSKKEEINLYRTYAKKEYSYGKAGVLLLKGRPSQFPCLAIHVARQESRKDVVGFVKDFSAKAVVEILRYYVLSEKLVQTNDLRNARNSNEWHIDAIQAISQLNLPPASNLMLEKFIDRVRQTQP